MTDSSTLSFFLYAGTVATLIAMSHGWTKLGACMQAARFVLWMLGLFLLGVYFSETYPV